MQRNQQSYEIRDICKGKKSLEFFFDEISIEIEYFMQFSVAGMSVHSYFTKHMAAERPNAEATRLRTLSRKSVDGTVQFHSAESQSSMPIQSNLMGATRFSFFI